MASRNHPCSRPQVVTFIRKCPLWTNSRLTLDDGSWPVSGDLFDSRRVPCGQLKRASRMETATGALAEKAFRSARLHPVEAPIGNRLGYVRCHDFSAFGKVRDRPRDFEDPVIRTRRQ